MRAPRRNTPTGSTPPDNPVRHRFWIFGPIGLLLAFFWQPALRLIAPFVLTSISSLLVGALVLFAVGAGLANRRLALAIYLLAVAVGGLGVGEAIYFTRAATPISDANDRRCARIEAHMLADTTTRGADAAMFQALGCRPQTIMPASWPVK